MARAPGGLDRSAKDTEQGLLAAIVARDVEPCFGAQGVGQVAVHDDQSLLVVQRPGKHASVVRMHDHRTSAAEHINT